VGATKNKGDGVKIIVELISHDTIKTHSILEVLLKIIN